MNKQKMISLDNGLTYHSHIDLDPFELECRWSAIAIAMVETTRDAAYDDKRWPRSAGAWRPFNAALFLELYLEYADESLTVKTERDELLERLAYYDKRVKKNVQQV